MRLTQRERMILWAAQHEPDIGIPALSKKVKLPSHSVRKVLQALEARGAIVRMSVINTSLLGYQSFDLYFATKLTDGKARERFKSALIADERVSMLIELGGDFDYGVTILTRSVTEISDFINDLSGQFGNIFTKKTVAVRESFYGFGRKYLVGKVISPIVRIETSSKRVPIDQTDHDILRKLSSLGTQSKAEVARSIGLPLTTVDYRIKRLTQEKVVERFIYGVMLEREGILLFRLLISCLDNSKQTRQALFSYCLEHPQIVNFGVTIGPWDYEAGIEITNQLELKSIVRDLQSTLRANLSSISIVPIFDIPKVRNYPFVRFPPTL